MRSAPKQLQPTPVERQATKKTFLFAAAFLVLVVGFALLLSHAGAGPNVPPRIVVLATWYSNGQQLVSFRTEPPGTVLTYSDLVSGSDGENAQPATIRSFGEVFPVHGLGQTNFSLRFVAVPVKGASFGGKPLAYTPGSYTMAYTPGEETYRVRVGVALQREGIGDYVQRLRICWESRSLYWLGRKSHQDPTFVTTGPITNAAAKGVKP